jgi:hypothetical protein
MLTDHHGEAGNGYLNEGADGGFDKALELDALIETLEGLIRNRGHQEKAARKSDVQHQQTKGRVRE